MAATYPITAAYMAASAAPSPAANTPPAPARRLAARAGTQAHPESNRHQPAVPGRTITGRAATDIHHSGDEREDFPGDVVKPR